MVLDQAVRLSTDAKVRFAALVHDLGKGTTPPQEWPGHRGHEERSVSLIESLSERLRLPNEYRELAVIVARYHGNVHRAFELRPKTILGILEKTDALRRPERFSQALTACEADSRGRLGLEQTPYPQRQYLQAARDAAAAIKPTPQEIAEHGGPQIAQHLHDRRLEAIAGLAARIQPGQDV
jgi:tRNA nucleotidyltransferase (CCA-adding enzyme)